MSGWPNLDRRAAEGPAPPPWAGLTAHASRAQVAPPVDPYREVARDAEPVETAELQALAPAARPQKPARTGLVAGLALSFILHASALAFFLDRLTRSGLEAEAVDAVSVELVAEAPPEPTIASTGSVAAEPAGNGTEAQDPAAQAVEADDQVVEMADTAAAGPVAEEAIELAEASAGNIESTEPAGSEDRLAEATAGEPLFVPPPPDAEPLETLASSPSAAGTESVAEGPLPPESEIPVPEPRPAVREPSTPAPNTAADKPAPRPAAKPAQAVRQEPAKAAGQAPSPSREAASAASGAGAAGGGSAGALAQYARSLNSHVQRHLRYPEAAARQRITGVTKLAITIDRGGRLSAVRVAAGSGHEVLDHEALAVARRAAPYPAPPDGVGKATLAFAVSLRFKP
jgi:protein TonB